MICKRTDTDPPVNRSTHSLADFGDFHRLEIVRNEKTKDNFQAHFFSY